MKPISYIVETPRDAEWGLVVRCVGYEKIGQGEKYPTDKHLDEYTFSPDKGRVLDEYQLVYITDGRGMFQSASVPPTRITAGTIFLLFPSEWHTYQPDPEKGWSQMWIGFRGDNMNQRVASGFFRKDKPFFRVGVHDDFIQLFMQAVAVAEHQPAHFQIHLAGIANHIIGMMYTRDCDNRFNQNPQMVNRINEARMLMLECIESAVTVQDIAAQLGMSYSLFRKQFKDYVGISPAAYFQDIKLRRAIGLLCDTQLTIKEIAYRLHFESPDYFSTQFKKKTGRRPSDFR